MLFSLLVIESQRRFRCKYLQNIVALSIFVPSKNKEINQKH